MAISRAKAFLEEVRRARMKVEAEQERLKEMMAALSYAHGAEFGMRVQSNTQTDISDKLIRLEEERGKYAGILLDFLEVEERAAMVLDASTSPVVNAVLYYRFVMNHTWERTGQEMGYTTEYLFRMARKGYRQIDEAYPDGRYPEP